MKLKKDSWPWKQKGLFLFLRCSHQVNISILKERYWGIERRGGTKVILKASRTKVKPCHFTYSVKHISSMVLGSPTLMAFPFAAQMASLWGCLYLLPSPGDTQHPSTIHGFPQQLRLPTHGRAHCLLKGCQGGFCSFHTYFGFPGHPLKPGQESHDHTILLFCMPIHWHHMHDRKIYCQAEQQPAP